jgi:hypothetical protein
MCFTSSWVRAGLRSLYEVCSFARDVLEGEEVEEFLLVAKTNCS